VTRRFRHLLKSHLFPRGPSIQFVLTVLEFAIDGESAPEDLLCVLDGSGENIELVSLTDKLCSTSSTMISDSTADHPPDGEEEDFQ
jgi:hypothetical protein